MKILVRGTNWIGDSVMTVPALRALRGAFPDAEIILYTRKSAGGIFADADFIDRIITIDKEKGLGAAIRKGRRLRNEKFDLAVTFPNSFASAVTPWLAGIPRRFGYSKDARRVLLTDAVRPPEWKDSRHEVFYYLELIRNVERIMLQTSTISDSDADVSLAVSSSRMENARQLLRERGLDLARPLIALGAGSTNSAAKRWPVERFAETARRLQNEEEASIVLLGSPADRPISNAIAESLTKKPIDLTGETDVEEAAAILSVADLLVSNDMGLAHLADAVGTKTIVIFGPTNHVTTRPFSPLAQIVRHEVECSPCMLRECPIDHRCMTRVTTDQVYQTAQRILEQNDE